MYERYEYPPAPPRPKKLGKHFDFGPSYRGGRHGLELENESLFVKPPRVTFGPTEPGTYGFPPLPEKPRLRPDKKNYDRPPRDLEPFGHYWLISTRLKEVLEAVDPGAMEFVECDTFYISGKLIEPKHHLCDTVRQIDAIDLDASRVKIEIEGDWKIYSLVGYRSVIFKDELVEGFHIFRQRHMPGVVCDAKVRAACLDAGIKDPHLFSDLSSW